MSEEECRHLLVAMLAYMREIGLGDLAARVAAVVAEDASPRHRLLSCLDALDSELRLISAETGRVVLARLNELVEIDDGKPLSRLLMAPSQMQADLGAVEPIDLSQMPELGTERAALADLRVELDSDRRLGL